MDDKQNILNKKEPQQKRAIETRDKLISAATKLFNEKGFYNTTTKDISKLAGVSVGIFYNYFEDKSKIYYECIKLNYKVGNAVLFTLTEEIFKDGISKEKIYNYFYSSLQNIRQSLTLILERDRIRIEYPEIDQLIRTGNDEASKIISNHLLGDDSEIVGKLLMETVNRNCIAVLSIEDTEEQEKYIKYLSDMIYHFYIQFQNK